MKTNAKNDGSSSAPRELDTLAKTQDKLTFPRASITMPFPELPSKMVVAIDGWAQSGKNTTGELVAESLGAVLVDSGRFYRAFTKACLDAGIHLEDDDAVAEFCWKSTLDIRLGRGRGRAQEAEVSVNGHWFTQPELNSVGNETSKVAGVFEVRQIVNKALRLCDNYGRVVMLGRDIGGVVIPDTHFKFFLDAPEEIREKRQIESSGHGGAIRRDHEDQKQVVFADKALMIDTGKLKPDEVCGIILVEIFWRAAQAFGNNFQGQ
jgi:cytidylate kinase